MPESGPGRVCPKCGRRVPRAVPKCRCGAILPADEAAVEESAGKSSPWPVYVALIALVAGVGYWTYLQPPAETPTTTSRPDVAAVAQPADELPAGTRQMTAEERAWNAAAKMADTTKSDPPTARPEPTLLSDPAVLPTGSLEEMVDAAMPAIVMVEATGGRGSAFYVTNDTLMTNVHVVQHDQYVTLRRLNGSTMTARVQTRAPNFDVAILKVAQPSPSQPFLAMATTNNLRPGQEVVVIGSALGTLQNSVSRGIVSGLRNSGGVTLIQSDAAANPGNSGGPMLDRNGRVIGILTAGYRNQQGLNFAVAIDHARDILEGRETNLGTGAPSIGEIETAVSGRTESDRRQQQGEQVFRQKLDAAESAARELDSVWQRFRSVCYKSPMLPRHDREWFALFVPGGLPSDAAVGCGSYFQDMQGEMLKFRTFMKTAIEEARRANVLPGTIRDTLRSKRLNFDY